MPDQAVTLTTAGGFHHPLNARSAAIVMWLAAHQDELARDLGSVRFDWGTGAPVRVKVEHSYPPIVA